jgi:SAM-dependent methyltransferase
VSNRNLDKAALRGEPSYVWREGQQRRLNMIVEAAGERARGSVLENGCGVGTYLAKCSPDVVNAAGEHLPFGSETFDLVLSHEVIEHVQDDRAAVVEMVRVLKPHGRNAMFCPNRGYPFETHGIYWQGKYSFGNKLFVNYLPRRWRDKLAPHVRAYSFGDLEHLFDRLPVRYVQRTIIFGAYDNIIARARALGMTLRTGLQLLEATPLRYFGLSHFWVIEKL